MRWHEVSLRMNEEASEATSHFLYEVGAGGVSIEQSSHTHRNNRTDYGEWYELPDNGIAEGQVVIKAYFSSDDEHKRSLYMNRIHEFIRNLSGWGLDPGEVIIEEKWIEDEDWAHAWKQYYKPVRISDRLIVKPTWEHYEQREGETVIELDPGMAFGTGTHATTTLCLRMLERYVRPRDRVVDVGTGSGILAIAAAHFGAKEVLAIDLDPVAVSSAKENVSINEIEDRVNVVEGDLLTTIHEKASYDVVVANILAEILVKFVDDVAEALKPGGLYIASGIIEKRRVLVEEALDQSGFEIVETVHDEDWVAIVARKR